MSTNDVQITDVLEIGIRLKRLSLNFYNRLSERHDNQKLSDIFSLLASEEEKHIGVFITLLDSIANYHPQFKYPGAYGKYLDGYATIVFANNITRDKYADEFQNILRSLNYRTVGLIEKIIELFKPETVEDALCIASDLEIARIIYFYFVKSKIPTLKFRIRKQ